MLEAYYKLMSRVMVYRLIASMQDTCARDQHGFITGKSCQTALLPITAGADDACKKGRPLQLVAIDILSAFDTIHPPLIAEVMRRQQLPVIFIDALHGLTTEGTSALRCNTMEGEKFSVQTGSGQGDPPSASRFTTGTEPLTRALDKLTAEFLYSIDNVKLPVSVFADDNMLPLCLRNLQDLQKVLTLFDDFYKISGLKLNLSKTEIMAFNTDPDLLQEIADRYGIKIVASLTYLGIEITGDFRETKKASYHKAVGKIGEKCNHIKHAHVSMLHKKLLVKQTVLPMINHVAMNVGTDPQSCHMIDKMIRETMWTRTIQGAEVAGRQVVAKERFDMSHKMGGLALEKTENTVKRILLNSLQRFSEEVGVRGPFSHEFLLHNLTENGFLSLLDMFAYGPLQWGFVTVFSSLLFLGKWQVLIMIYAH
jgi:hypothetical protein